MEKVLRMALLFDIYGGLLTKKQSDIFKMHYFDDFSLHEIGAKHGITRQAVSDILRRTEKNLENYEQKLGFLLKFATDKKIIENIKEAIQENEILTEKIIPLLDALHAE